MAFTGSYAYPPYYRLWLEQDLQRSTTISIVSVLLLFALAFRALRILPVVLLPLCALSAILFVVAYNMSELPHFLDLARHAPANDRWVLLITFALTVFADLVLAVGTPGDDAEPYLIHNRKREDCRITAAPARAAAGTLVVDPLTAKRLRLSAGASVRAVPLSAQKRG